MVEGARKVLWLPEGKCRTPSKREEYVKELARQDFIFITEQNHFDCSVVSLFGALSNIFHIINEFIMSHHMVPSRHVQVDAYGPGDKDGGGRECSVKGWCGDDDACLLASQ